ncbi:MAG: hypothetical protein IPK79_03040 [Vampirovibrionales bacterium]|nr:hypothetical protein [Vampirovibrionales bacterium]
MGLSFFNPWKPIKDTNRATGMDIQLPRPEKGMKTDAQLAAKDARNNDDAARYDTPASARYYEDALAARNLSSPAALPASSTQLSALSPRAGENKVGAPNSWHAIKAFRGITSENDAAREIRLDTVSDRAPALSSPSTYGAATTYDSPGLMDDSLSNRPAMARMMMSMMRLLIGVLMTAAGGGAMSGLSGLSGLGGGGYGAGMGDPFMSMGGLSGLSGMGGGGYGAGMGDPFMSMGGLSGLSGMGGGGYGAGMGDPFMSMGGLSGLSSMSGGAYGAGMGDPFMSMGGLSGLSSMSGGAYGAGMGDPFMSMGGLSGLSSLGGYGAGMGDLSGLMGLPYGRF